MKYILKFSILCLLFTVSLLSCSKSSSNENERAQEPMIEGNEENKEEIKLEFTLVKSNYEHTFDVRFTPKVNGNYIVFDNDADYQELCNPVWFLGRCVGLSATYSFAAQYEHTNNWLESSELMELLKELPNAVDLYINGNKDKIKDERIKKLIDEAWYNLHPNNCYFQLQDNSYNFKLYYGNPYGTVICSPNDSEQWYDLDGNKLPEGVLLIDAY